MLFNSLYKYISYAKFLKQAYKTRIIGYKEL